MKKNNIIYALLFVVLALTSCIKNEDILLKENLVEFDAATYNANALGKTYPAVRQVPPYGFAMLSSSPVISRTSGTISFRVNVVGPQTAADRVITYKVVPNETFTQVISGVSRTAVTAVRGTHYTTSGTLTIPAMSSFGILTVTINNPGTALVDDLLIVLELEGNTELKPSNADKQLGIWINRG
jgi:hypothetical protein